MLFRSSRRRRYFQSFFWLIAFDIALVFAFITISGDEREFWVKLIFGVIILWLIQLAIALKSALFSFLYFWVIDRDRRIETTVSEMAKRDIPKYGDDMFLSAEEYLEKVASDLNAPIKAIAFAAANLGALGVFRLQQQIQSAFQWSVVMERALEQYVRDPEGERRKAPTPTDDELGLSPSQKEAFATGKDFARAMAEHIDDFMLFRFGDLNEKYLTILEQNFDQAIQQQEHSPIIITRIDYQVHLENIEEVEPKIRDELNDHVADYRNSARKIGAEEEFDRLIDDRVTSLITTMKTSSLELFLEKADQLKAADDKWRAENPEQAKLEPLELDEKS